VLDFLTARTRSTRSGRSIYGAHPALGPHFYTTGGKLERRRARSRLAALCRGEKVVIEGRVTGVVGR
jgi:hypothetical protein